jgi:hypothetical protein
MSPVRYELGFYIPEDAILHSHRRENLKSYNTTSRLRSRSNNFRLHTHWTAPHDNIRVAAPNTRVTNKMRITSINVDFIAM